MVMPAQPVCSWCGPVYESGNYPCRLVQAYRDPANALDKHCQLCELCKTTKQAEPNWWQKALTFVQAAAAHVTQGMPQVTEEEYQRRIHICQACDFFKNGSCLKCGCQVMGTGLFTKARWKNQVCPISKW